MFQSSPAPRRGRYAIMTCAFGTSDMFQSSPAPRRGRYFGRLCNRNDALVSILARTEARALRSPGRMGCHNWYVSILARTEARALQTLSCKILELHLFQSSPAPRRGRYLAELNASVIDEDVSILARTEARALRLSCPLMFSRILVSILARTEARALLALL